MEREGVEAEGTELRRKGAFGRWVERLVERLGVNGLRPRAPKLKREQFGRAGSFVDRPDRRRMPFVMRRVERLAVFTLRPQAPVLERVRIKRAENIVDRMDWRRALLVTRRVLRLEDARLRLRESTLTRVSAGADRPERRRQSLWPLEWIAWRLPGCVLELHRWSAIDSGDDEIVASLVERSGRRSPGFLAEMRCGLASALVPIGRNGGEDFRAVFERTDS